MALLVVLSAIAFLLPLIFSGLEMGRFHLRRVRNELYLQEARRYAESGLSQVVATLQQDAAAGMVVDHLGEPWAVGMAAMEDPSRRENQATENRQLTIVVEDSARYLNLNDLVHNGTVDAALRGVLERLLRQKGLNESLLEALIDWLDKDNGSTGFGGAENAWYQTAGHPYGPENGPLQELQNLALLRGWSETAVELVRPVVRALDRRCSSSGVNINTASQEVLSLLDGVLHVEPLLEMRQEKAITDLAVLAAEGVFVNQAVSPLLRIKSDCFEVNIRSQVGAVSGLLQVWLLRTGGKVEVLRAVWSG